MINCDLSVQCPLKPFYNVNMIFSKEKSNKVDFEKLLLPVFKHSLVDVVFGAKESEKYDMGQSLNNS